MCDTILAPRKLLIPNGLRGAKNFVQNLRSLISLSSLVFSVCDISFMYLTINTKKVLSLFGDTIFVAIFVTLISDKYN